MEWDDPTAVTAATLEKYSTKQWENDIHGDLSSDDMR